MLAPWVFHVAVSLPFFWFCSSQVVNATLPTSRALMLLLTTETFGMRDFKDVSRLCNRLG